MFFSNDVLLSKKKGSLGIIWLAATLGPKSQAKKLSRRDLSSVNVTETCEFLINPPEPLALRLTSNLMVGLVKIYHQQCILHLSEVQTFWQKIQGMDILQRAHQERRQKQKGEIHGNAKETELGGGKNEKLEDNAWMTPEVGRKLSMELDEKLSSMKKLDIPRKLSLTGSNISAGFRRESFSSLSLGGGGGFDDGDAGYMAGEFMDNLLRESMSNSSKLGEGLLLGLDSTTSTTGINLENQLELQEMDALVPNLSPEKKKSPQHQAKRKPGITKDSLTEIAPEEISAQIKDPKNTLKKNFKILWFQTEDLDLLDPLGFAKELLEDPNNPDNLGAISGERSTSFLNPSSSGHLPPYEGGLWEDDMGMVTMDSSSSSIVKTKRKRKHSDSLDKEMSTRRDVDARMPPPKIQLEERLLDVLRTTTKETITLGSLIQERTKRAAARAFYNVLELASRNKIRVYQKAGPFTDIMVTKIEDVF